MMPLLQDREEMGFAAAHAQQEGGAADRHAAGRDRGDAANEAKVRSMTVTDRCLTMGTVSGRRAFPMRKKR